MKHFLVIPALFVCLLLFPPVSAKAEFSTTPEDLTGSCKLLTRSLASEIPEGKSVAVRLFLSPGGIRTLLGLRIQDLVRGLDGGTGYYQLRQKDLKTLIQRLAVLPRSAWWEESVEQVSWNDCRKFIDRLNGKSGGRQKFALPTEAQWEYACRSGGKPEKYAGGGDVDRVAWYDKNSGSSTHEVGTKAPNGLGIYDMSGNVWEWCEDWYRNYSSGSHKNPTGIAGGSDRVKRGGSWPDEFRVVRCGNRYDLHPDLRYFYLGFRLVRTN